MDRFFPSVILAAVDAIEFRGSRICRVGFGRLELLWYNVRLLRYLRVGSASDINSARAFVPRASDPVIGCCQLT